MDFVKDLLGDKDQLLRYFIYVICGLGAISLLNYVCMFLGKKVKPLNNIAGMTTMFMMPLGLAAILIGLLLGCAWMQIPWFISGFACAFIFIIGVGYMWSRSR